MKLPDAPAYAEEDERDREGRFLDRISMTERAVETMEEFFSLFLKKDSKRGPDLYSTQV